MERTGANTVLDYIKTSPGSIKGRLRARGGVPRVRESKRAGAFESELGL